MKFLGQFIQDFIARFRNDVYLEDVDSGTIASGSNLGLDSNNKIVKASIAADVNTTYSVSCVDGDNSDEEKIRLTGSDSSTDDVVLEAGTGLSIARSGDKITFTNTVSDTNTQLSNAEVRTAVEAASDSNVFTDADHTKLNGIEASADVTDTANVTSAGALMDSEVTNLADVKSFDTSDYATAAQGAKADSAQQPPSEGAFANGDKTKLDGIEANATADQTAGEIRTLLGTGNGNLVPAAGSDGEFLKHDGTFGTPSYTTNTNTQLSTEQVQDIVGGMLGGTETRIGVTYDDTNGRIDFVVDDMTADTNTNQLTTFTLTGDGGSNQTIAHGNTLDIAGGNAITTAVGATDTVTINHDDTSSQASVNNSGSTYIQDVTLDTYGHVTGLTSAAIPTLNQDTTGSAATLTTARNIAGVSFDGSADISLNNNAITNGAGYTTNTGDITGVSITTDSGSGSKAEDTGGSADFSILGSSGVGVTNSSNTITAVAVPGEIDHDSLLNFVAAEHYRWDTDISGTATINAANIPTLNQDTTGQAGTVATIAGLAPNTATTQATQPNITTLAGLTSFGAAGTTTDIAAGDLTMYNAVNNGNPTFSIGSSATNRLVIQPVYNSGGQTIDYAEFNTYTTSSSNHDGRYLFKVDEVEIARLLDTGALFQGLVQTTGDGARVVCKDTDTSSASNGAEVELRTDDGAAMGNNHRLGIIKFTGAENSSNTITTGAQIEAFCEAAWSASENGARLVFSTTDGNASTSTVLTLDSNKQATFTGPIACTTRTLDVTSSTDGDANGDVVYFGGTTSMTVGKIYHYKSDGTWEIANADAVSTADGLLGVALGSASDTDGVLLRGMVTLDHDPGAIGDVLYVQSDNAGTPGNATATAPSASGDCVRIVGYQVSHASNGNIWFNPDNTFVEVA
tara:strand:+ start:1678 stop:4407 length:2730 start_codon:yes stop_codon:yes gene_type:complete